MRVSIFGIGNVGSTIAFGILHGVLASEIDIFDKNEQTLQGQYSDLIQAKEVFQKKRNIEISRPIYPRSSDIYIISIGEPMPHGNTDRTVQYEKYSEKIKIIIKQIAKARHENSLTMIITNPSGQHTKDALDHIPLVIPCGNMIDNARLRLCKVQGSHEAPDIQEKYLEVAQNKGYTNFSITAEVLTRVAQWRQALL